MQIEYFTSNLLGVALHFVDLTEERPKSSRGRRAANPEPANSPSPPVTPEHQPAVKRDKGESGTVSSPPGSPAATPDNRREDETSQASPRDKGIGKTAGNYHLHNKTYNTVFNSISAVKLILRGCHPLNVQQCKCKFFTTCSIKNTCIQQTPLLSDMDILNLTSWSLLLLKTFIKLTLQTGCLLFMSTF